jgi:hypothetical protein
MKTGFLEEQPGVKSSQRLIFVAGMIWGMALISFIVYKKSQGSIEIGWTDLGIFAGIIFGIFTTGKLFQKSQEQPPTTPVQ